MAGLSPAVDPCGHCQWERMGGVPRPAGWHGFGTPRLCPLDGGSAARRGERSAVYALLRLRLYTYTLYTFAISIAQKGGSQWFPVHLPSPPLLDEGEERRQLHDLPPLEGLPTPVCSASAASRRTKRAPARGRRQTWQHAEADGECDSPLSVRSPTSRCRPPPPSIASERRAHTLSMVAHRGTWQGCPRRG